MNIKRSRFTSAHSADSAIYKFKGEAAELQAEARTRSETMSRGAALEAVAARHGFRDWNTARAALELASEASKRPAFEQVDQPLPMRSVADICRSLPRPRRAVELTTDQMTGAGSDIQVPARRL